MNNLFIGVFGCCGTLTTYHSNSYSQSTIRLNLYLHSSSPIPNPQTPNQTLLPNRHLQLLILMPQIRFSNLCSYSLIPNSQLSIPNTHQHFNHHPSHQHHFHHHHHSYPIHLDCNITVIRPGRIQSLKSIQYICFRNVARANENNYG